jgi:type I restriction enzyme, S subunit
MNNSQLPKGYKPTEVGMIPEDWDITRLSNIARKNYGLVDGPFGSNLQASSYVLIGVPVIRGSNLSLGERYFYDDGYVFVSEEKANQIKRSICHAEDIIFTKKGTIGQTGIVPKRSIYKKYLLSSNQMKLSVEKDIADPYFVYYSVSSSQSQEKIIQESASTGVPNFNLRQLSQFTIALPPLPEQRSLATTLSDMDALLAGLDKLIAKKRDLKQAAMQQLLTGKTRLPGFGGRKEYKQTEVGITPEDWDYLPIGHFVTEFRGGAPLKPSDFTRTGVKVLPKGGVVRGGLLTIYEKDLQFCSQDYAEKYSKNQVDESYTIVVLRDLVPSGPNIGLIVRYSQQERYVLAQGVYGFKVTEGVLPEYLIQYSNSFSYRRLMNEIMVGSTQVHITNTAFQSAKLPFPKVEEQTAIATILSDMDSAIAALEQRRDKTRALKQAMMQELLTGRIRLKIEA